MPDGRGFMHEETGEKMDMNIQTSPDQILVSIRDVSTYEYSDQTWPETSEVLEMFSYMNIQTSPDQTDAEKRRVGYQIRVLTVP